MKFSAFSLAAMVLSAVPFSVDAYGHNDEEDGGRRLYGYGENSWFEHAKGCNDEDYQVSLVAKEGHLLFLLEPVDATMCKNVWVHDNQGKLEAFAFEVDDEINVDKLPVTIKKLGEVEAAFEDIKSNWVTRDYDIVSNNCGIFLLKMALEMGVDVHPEHAMFGYTTNHLSKTSTVADMVRNSASAGEILDANSLESFSDSQLVDAVVQHYAHMNH